MYINSSSPTKYLSQSRKNNSQVKNNSFSLNIINRRIKKMSKMDNNLNKMNPNSHKHGTNPKLRSWQIQFLFYSHLNWYCSELKIRLSFNWHASLKEIFIGLIQFLLILFLLISLTLANLMEFSSRKIKIKKTLNLQLWKALVDNFKMFTLLDKYSRRFKLNTLQKWNHQPLSSTFGDLSIMPELKAGQTK